MDVKLLLFFFLIGLNEISQGPSHCMATVCRGTRQKFSHSGTPQTRYETLRRKYTNCTYIEGNLEIVFLIDLSIKYDFSFLETIKEITGYVLIVHVYADYIPLTNLQIIRGRELLEVDDQHYSLYVANNYDETYKKIGLKELRFKSLGEILSGKVAFVDNLLLCYEVTVNWTDINPTSNPPVIFVHSEGVRRQCEPCHSSCYQNITKRRNCWGSGPDMCQKLSFGPACSASCDNRCFGYLPNQCCHTECAAGCTGPKKTDCLACRKFKNDGACVPFCPQMYIYNEKTFQQERNPNYKYSYGSLCVKDCPKHMLKDNAACVRKCPVEKQVINNTCVKCEGACPKTCEGTKLWLTSKNIKPFKDCTIIEGNLVMYQVSFDGDSKGNISALSISDLDYLKSIREITGYLVIQASPPELETLSFLENLEAIGGRNEAIEEKSLFISGTNLLSLGLTKLKHILNGNVVINGNKKLCYAETIAFGSIFITPGQKEYVFDNSDTCGNKTCDPQCKNGCWGAGPKQCLSCANYCIKKINLCVASCFSVPLHYDAGKKICKKCHSQCANNCIGPKENDCDSCLKVQYGPNCIDKCPLNMFPNQKKICQQCHKDCDSGCSGPSYELKNGGCHSCAIGLQQTDGRVLCFTKESFECPDDFHRNYKEDKMPQMKGKILCVPCHEECKSCYGKGNYSCISCRNFKMHPYCTSKCPSNYFSDREQKKCIKCHNECLNECFGSTSSDCTACRNFKTYLSSNRTAFNCSGICPSSKPHSIVESEVRNALLCVDDTHPVIVSKIQEKEKKTNAIAIVTSVVTVIILVILLIIYYYCRRAREIATVNKLNAAMMGYDENEPLNPTSAKPNLAKLRLIKESELRKGGIIGSGAFGTVYKGFWIPDGENVKIPVAIKVLQEGTSPSQNKELLEEARVMCSVDQQCCIRILAVCMTAQMMLITPLMPLGCLLDYIRKHQKAIGSKVLLNWCTQIAKGMAYLEGRAIVHRDLAARNVLLQTPNQIRITDFGLAKLLDYNEEEYIAAGGKMPIKWLALECIQHRIFTHKSDVWSYGVTVWELFTYGQRPYENVRAAHVPDLLEKGERLPQPNICTIDVYMIMIKCWMLDAESRPSFKELEAEFGKMSRDPGRYLVIEGDKLMRLPSLTYDKRDLLQSLSLATEGPEELVEAEDYLMPQSSQAAADSNGDNNNDGSKIASGNSPEDVFHTDVGIEKQNELDNRRREKRYGHLESAAAARHQRQMNPHHRGREDSINSRYSTDPIKYSRDRDNIEFDPNHMMGYQPKQVPTAPFLSSHQLPVDEDDYLQPKSSNPAAYIDFNDTYKNNYEPTNDELMKDILGATTMASVENPEYFEQNNTTDHLPGASDSFQKGNDNDIPYYNDISKLEKGPQVLKSLVPDDNTSETKV
ncbi:epidermal growth factor receptor isoform X1 [Octopus bimaculoides]|nr:epidermal growth factor receptor isoform X1 [Octopus bimaculoides]|eukprot:XP_014767891.1 PREDICTED: epidermal growth factor receptor-like isoform X1 [Octopus bimaculoides]